MKSPSRSASTWLEEPVGKQHRRDAFDCGVPAPNDYLRRFARQDHDHGASKTFVAVEPGDRQEVLGYYTICPASVEYARVPVALTRRLARYDVPAFRLARLAVSVSAQGRGLGGELLLAAGARALAVASEVGGVLLVIDAKDDRAAQWYRRFGALSLEDAERVLVLPLATIAEALRRPSEG